jgi:hypothetical protein
MSRLNVPKSAYPHIPQFNSQSLRSGDDITNNQLSRACVGQRALVEVLKIARPVNDAIT